MNATAMTTLQYPPPLRPPPLSNHHYYSFVHCPKSLHWGLNPGPSVYRTDALPLSYRGLRPCEKLVREVLSSETMSRAHMCRALTWGQHVSRNAALAVAFAATETAMDLDFQRFTL